MGRWHGLMALAALGVTITGCTSGKDLAAAQAENSDLRTKLATVQQEYDSSKTQLGPLLTEFGEKDAALTELDSENAELKAQLDDINTRYSQAMQASEKFGSNIPPAVAYELTTLANANSDVIEFDAQRGLLKLKSDLSFALGSADLTPKARDVVATLAKILSSDSAKSFELMVAGHTDAMPVSKHSTIAAGHKNNWYLSAHRAIAVGSELQAKSISPRRLAMVGYAEQRPVAGNDTETGRAKNRRVEILLLPKKVSDQTPVVWKGGSKSTTATTNKPSGSSSAGVNFNK